MYTSVPGMGPIGMHHWDRKHQTLKLKRDTSMPGEPKNIPTWKAKKPAGLGTENSGTQLR